MGGSGGGTHSRHDGSSALHSWNGSDGPFMSVSETKQRPGLPGRTTSRSRCEKPAQFSSGPVRAFELTSLRG